MWRRFEEGIKFHCAVFLRSHLSNQHMKLFSLNLFYCMKIEIFTQNSLPLSTFSRRQVSSSAAIKYNSGRVLGRRGFCSILRGFKYFDSPNSSQFYRFSFSRLSISCEKQLNLNGSIFMHAVERFSVFLEYSAFSFSSVKKKNWKTENPWRKVKVKLEKLEKSSIVLNCCYSEIRKKISLLHSDIQKMK